MTAKDHQEQCDWQLIKSLLERGGTGKMRSFWEENSENITYKVQPETDLNGKIHTWHRNMLLSSIYQIITTRV